MTPPPPSTFLVLLLLLVVPLSFLCDAQSDDAPSPPPPSPFFDGRFNPSMAIIIVILVTAFFFLGFFSIYLRQCGNGEEGTVLGSTGLAVRSRRAAARGLDSSLIESLPTLVYSDVKDHKIGKGALECAVCLCEFEDNETLRLLPKCDHVFHTECIDMWLSSHTTCPVCRDNLAVNDDAEAPPVANLVAPPPPPPAGPADVTVDVAAEEQPPLRPDHVAIRVVEDEAAAVTVEGDRRPEVVVGDLGRNGSKRSGRSLLSWRSRSARPAMQHWSEEDRERFTLRLPEYVRREVLVGKLNRSASVAAFRAGEGSSRRGYRGGGGGGEGSSRGGGRSLKMAGRLDWVTRSDRWALLSRPLSFKITRGGDGEGSSIKRGEGSARKGGDGDGEGSTKGKVFARGPLDCLGGGAKESGDGEGSTVGPAKV